jgi:apolipoprotein N-acyltransferase
MNDKESPLNEKSKVTLQTKIQAESTLDVTSLPQKSDFVSPDLSVIDEQWAEMTQDWQSQPTPKTDIAKLLKQTEQRTVWAKCLLAIDIIATLGMLSVALYMWLSGSQDQATIIYLGVGGVLSVIFVYYAIRIRLAAWKVNCGSPDKAIEHAISGCESSISYIKLIKFSCFIFLPFVNWYIFTINQQVSKSPILGLILINVLVILIWSVTHHFYLKRQKELKQLKTILK